MKITRNINGQEIEIELTPEELRKAFDEYDLASHIEDIRSNYVCDDLDDSAVATIAKEWQKELSKNDPFWESYWAVLSWVAAENDLKTREDF